ncbi:MAG: LON peptidase substrate-binding domain-containing protein [Acidobacteriota bacterium]|nr:MAG: LON peptidase substrate-binding domain-containing protein [Acidobacteriota bacterium]
MRKEIPVFPLPSALLLPGVMLPLHVFEPRYKKMVEAVQARGKHLAVAWARVEEGVLEPCEVACAGSVQILREYEGGRKDILVSGRTRVRLIEYVQEVPYRVARCEPLPMVGMPQAPYARRLRELKKAFARWVFLGFRDADRVIHYLNALHDLDSLANFIVYHFVGDLASKQSYLEMDGLEEKTGRLLDFVRNETRALESHINLLRPSREDETTN